MNLEELKNREVTLEEVTAGLPLITATGGAYIGFPVFGFIEPQEFNENIIMVGYNGTN